LLAATITWYAFEPNGQAGLRDIIADRELSCKRWHPPLGLAHLLAVDGYGKMMCIIEKAAAVPINRSLTLIGRAKEIEVLEIGG
jgi:hypothetical protein